MADWLSLKEAGEGYLGARSGGREIGPEQLPEPKKESPLPLQADIWYSGIHKSGLASGEAMKPH